MKKKITEQDYLKAARKGSREAEIELHGHPVNRRKVHKSKKIYDRKKIKAGLKPLPYLFSASAALHAETSRIIGLRSSSLISGMVSTFF